MQVALDVQELHANKIQLICLDFDQSKNQANKHSFLKNCVITVQKRCKDIQPDFCLTSDDSVFILTDGQNNKQSWRIVNQIGPEA